jgi:site-specific recombinase XerD
MSDIRSFLSPQVNNFIYFRRTSGNWNESSYEPNLRLFDRYIAENYPGFCTLTQEMVDTWCAKRETETNNSCRSRIYAVVSFIKYLRERNITDIGLPEIPRKEKRTYIPHSFTDTELKDFFRECDAISVYNNNPSHKLRKIVVPVFFRLLFSSGMRTTEARLLKRDGVDLDNGIVNISNSKGHNQHYVVLHDSMSLLMRRYDVAADKRIPGRKFFFPSTQDKPRPRGWVVWNFSVLWSKVSNESATAYELRHNYATHNINNWTESGFGFDDKLLYLSKSMGHSYTEETKKYFSIVPTISDILREKTQRSMDDIIPEVHKNEEAN